MYKLNKAALAIVVANSVLLSGGVHSTPIPDTPDEWYHGSQNYMMNDPRSACDDFNSKVKLINDYIADKYPDSGLVYDQLCKSFRVTEKQIEDQRTFTNWVAYYSGYDIIDTVDVARTIDILVFSGTGKTRYMQAINGSADLTKQEIPRENVWRGKDMAPFHYGRDHWFGNNWHGTNQKSYISGRFAIKTAQHRADNFFSGQSPTPEEYNTKVLEYLSDRCTSENNSDCIPSGGAYNSGNFVFKESYPKDTYEDKTVTVATEQTMSYNISGSFEGSKSDGLSAGMSVDMGYSNSTSQSQDLKVFYISNFSGSNDISATKEYQVSAQALLAVEDSGVISYVDDSWGGRVANPDEAFGSGTWRKLDLESLDIWEEEIDGQYCNEEMAIGNTLNLARSTLDIDGNSIDHSDSSTVNHRFDYGVFLKMKCQVDANGNAIKAVKIGSLDK